MPLAKTFTLSFSELPRALLLFVESISLCWSVNPSSAKIGGYSHLKSNVAVVRSTTETSIKG